MSVTDQDAPGLAASIIATSFLSGLFGMAGGMVLMGLLLVLLPVPAAMVLHGCGGKTPGKVSVHLVAIWDFQVGLSTRRQPRP